MGEKRKIGEKIGEERCERKRGTVMYKVQSLRQNTQRNVKHIVTYDLENVPVYGHFCILHKDRQTGIAV